MKRREFIAGLLLTASMQRALAREDGKQYHIAIVVPSAPVTEISETARTVWRSFFEELRRLGYIEGKNLIVERYSGGGRTEVYADLSRDVVRLKPDVIFGVAVSTVQNLKAATTTIPARRPRTRSRASPARRSWSATTRKCFSSAAQPTTCRRG